MKRPLCLAACCDRPVLAVCLVSARGDSHALSDDHPAVSASDDVDRALAAVSYLARYSGRTHVLYACQSREWFTWCERNALDPLVGIQRAHVELYIRALGDHGLTDSSVATMMHAERGYFGFTHIDGLIAANPVVYARLPKIHRDESRTQGLDRLELIRFLQIAQTITVHHGALASREFCEPRVRPGLLHASNWDRWSAGCAARRTGSRWPAR